MQLWDARGSARSAVYRVFVLDARELEAAMRQVCDSIDGPTLDALAGVDASHPMAAAASRVAALVLERLPAPPAPFGERAARSMLILTGLDSMKRRLGKGENGPSERRFIGCAMALAQATVLSILAEKPTWHVYLATQQKAVAFVGAIVRAVDQRALIDR